MYTAIVFPGGRQVDALMLSATPNCLRVVIPGRADTAEFQMIEGRWTAESGAQVELGAIVVLNTADAARILANARPLTLAAG